MSRMWLISQRNVKNEVSLIWGPRIDNMGLWDFYSFSLGFLAKEKRQPAINSQTTLAMSAL